MDPIEMVATAEELHLHMLALARMDSHYTSNAVAIEQRRQLATECVERLSAYLVGSNTFAGA